MHQMEVTMQDGGKNVEERAGATSVCKRDFYKFGEHVRMEEDQRIEFKAHKNISIEELSPACKDQHSRQTISRTICAFLNTGRGGTIFLGILDNGEVNGLHLTEYQKDHLALSLETLMQRYKPAVPKHMYELRFVPVISEGVPLPTNERREMNSKERFRPHKLQCSKPCWCDDEATAQLSVGRSVMRYVVEIKLSAWDSSDPRNSGLNKSKMGIHPMFDNEEDICFLRRQGSNIRCTLQDVIDITRQEVKSYYCSKTDIQKPLEETSTSTA
ncbi:schlafen-like protein 2 isoform X1 [Rhipicephalus microplus]|uniref:schlafen-like protein 2 isoform X1 n=1 Tax=Rhipicephalus microplus TaxID=6941 RepID=UPI003F6BCD8C